MTAGRVWPSRISVRASFGAIVDGALEEQGQRHEIGPGIVGAASVAKQWAFGDWFVTGSFGVAVSRTTTSIAGGPRETLVAADIARAGVMAGRTFSGFSPYVLARGFGGPVYWELDGMEVTGTDTHKFQLGAGASYATGRGLAFVVDVSALGERSASLGMSLEL